MVTVLVRGCSVELSTGYSALVTYLYYHLIISLIAPYLTSLSLEILSRCSLMFSGLLSRSFVYVDCHCHHR